MISKVWDWLSALLVALVFAGFLLITLFVLQPALIPRLLVYTKYCLDRSEYRGVTPKELDAIMQKEPGNWYELHGILYPWVSAEVPRKGDREWESYTQSLDSCDSCTQELDKKVKQWDVRWYPGATPSEHRYTEIFTARTLFQAAVNTVDWNGNKAGTNYYFLLDKDLRILGWAKEFNGRPSW